MGINGQNRLTLLNPSSDNLVLKFAGDWKLKGHLPSIKDVEGRIKVDSNIKRLGFDTKEIGAWDSALLIFLTKLNKLCLEKNIKVELYGLPIGVVKLLKLATAVPKRKDDSHGESRKQFITDIGLWIIEYFNATLQTINFIGEVFLAFVNLILGKARFRKTDFITVIQECGVQALPIVTLISLLMGMILAFVGSIQLKMFGAEIFVANLVGLGMAREMGAMMTAIIMAGRTGAAFSAQLGSMHVNDEIDALRTMGISPMEALVLPRMLALTLMMPLLCIYANFIGIIGGAIVAITSLDISLIQYFEQSRNNLGLIDFIAGLIKSVVFGVIVATSGCLRGMQCGKSSTDVGNTTTSAVVTGIVYIVVSDAILTMIYSIIGF